MALKWQHPQKPGSPLMFHQNTLQHLNENILLGEKLTGVHSAIKGPVEKIQRKSAKDQLD